MLEARRRPTRVTRTSDGAKNSAYPSNAANPRKPRIKPTRELAVRGAYRGRRLALKPSRPRRSQPFVAGYQQAVGRSATIVCLCNRTVSGDPVPDPSVTVGCHVVLISRCVAEDVPHHPGFVVLCPTVPSGFDHAAVRDRATWRKRRSWHGQAPEPIPEPAIRVGRRRGMSRGGNE